jgi:hypothetical protein
MRPSRPPIWSGSTPLSKLSAGKVAIGSKTTLAPPCFRVWRCCSSWPAPGSAPQSPRDPLYRIRKLLRTAAEQLTDRGRARLRAGLTAGDPTGEVAAAWQGKELLRAVYAAAGTAAARAALDRFYRWADGVQI